MNANVHFSCFVRLGVGIVRQYDGYMNMKLCKLSPAFHNWHLNIVPQLLWFRVGDQTRETTVFSGYIDGIDSRFYFWAVTDVIQAVETLEPEIVPTKIFK